jgi:single-stranded DNA-specific DHH superfamily exonuclease
MATQDGEKSTGYRMFVITASAYSCRKNSPDPYSIGFEVAPRINAGGRLDNLVLALVVIDASKAGRAMRTRSGVLPGTNVV